MGIFRKTVSFKIIGILLAVMLIVVGGVTYFVLSAQEQKKASEENKATKTIQEATTSVAKEKTKEQKQNEEERSNTSTNTTANKNTNNSGDSEDSSGKSGNSSPPATAKTVTVFIIGSGFSPSSMTINTGDTVKWANNDNKSHWPASDPHPQHTDYFGFDSFGISAGSSWSFKFNEKGSWYYHDHQSPSKTGVVIVQ